jgi:hypothetical protein
MYKIRGGDGKEYGPVTAEQIIQWLRENRVNGQSLVQADGSAEWQPLSAFPEFRPQLAASPPVPPTVPVPPTSSTPTVTAKQDVPTYLVPAILCTLFCCLPFGVPAIVYAAQVSSKQATGDIAGAQIASKNARTWCWVAFGVGVIWVIVVSLVMAAAFAKVGARQGIF